MKSVMSALRDTVPINQFNRGLAGKIFEEVKKSGAKVVMKNNTAECVLLSPEEYAKLIDEICDARLLLLASDRMSRADLSKTVTQEEVYRELGLSAADLLGDEDVELE
ncbi:type II toxin-antitoxin system Phd/YefM family antitoxin [Stomatobaculum longum]|jgi:phd_YefM|uniref:type II toxin-antitoxin system Phd/YefM family antitoxin n=1 Tax=Stomatobaculum longum TaxID=796942 RepID=UPI0028E4E182|nr:type II toxin-antitoxin system Phd/YefM family antitoxin [Stomatobaculum longum]